MSITARIVIAITFQQVDSTPNTKASTERNNEGLEDFDSTVKKFHSRFSFIIKKL